METWLVFHREKIKICWEKDKIFKKGLVKLDGCFQKNINKYIFNILQETQVKVEQRTQNKTRYIESDKKESGNSLGYINTDNFLNRTLILTALRQAINVWDLIKVKSV